MKSILIISIYFILWAVVHSFLASLTAKHFAEKIFGGQTRKYYRLFFVLFAVITLLPLLYLLITLPDKNLYTIRTPFSFFMTGGQIFGGIIIILSILITEPLDFIGIAQLRRNYKPPSNPLKKNGIYGWVRHPMYFGSLIIMWCIPSMTVNYFALFVCMTVYFYIGSIHEEILLTHSFGPKYEKYKSEIPRILPRIFRSS